MRAERIWFTRRPAKTLRVRATTCKPGGEPLLSILDYEFLTGNAGIRFYLVRRVPVFDNLP